MPWQSPTALEIQTSKYVLIYAQKKKKKKKKTKFKDLKINIFHQGQMI